MEEFGGKGATLILPLRSDTSITTLSNVRNSPNAAFHRETMKTVILTYNCLFCPHSESISFSNYQAGQPDVQVPNGIVKMDENNNYSFLEDPNNVFNEGYEILSLVTSTDSSTLFISTSDKGEGDTKSIYSWTEANYYKKLATSANITGILTGDSHNNIYSHVLPFGGTNCNLAFFNASNDYQRLFSPFRPFLT